MSIDRNTLLQAADFAARHLMRSKDWTDPGSSGIELEGLLHMYAAFGRDDYLQPVLAAWEKRKAGYRDLQQWLLCQFCLPFELYLCRAEKD